MCLVSSLRRGLFSTTDSRPPIVSFVASRTPKSVGDAPTGNHRSAQSACPFQKHECPVGVRLFFPRASRCRYTDSSGSSSHASSRASEFGSGVQNWARPAASTANTPVAARSASSHSTSSLAREPVAVTMIPTSTPASSASTNTISQSGPYHSTVAPRPRSATSSRSGDRSSGHAWPPSRTTAGPSSVVRDTWHSTLSGVPGRWTVPTGSNAAGSTRLHGASWSPGRGDVGRSTGSSPPGARSGMPPVRATQPVSTSATAITQRPARTIPICGGRAAAARGSGPARSRNPARGYVVSLGPLPAGSSRAVRPRPSCRRPAGGARCPTVCTGPGR
jgi:hypothetical protein